MYVLERMIGAGAYMMLLLLVCLLLGRIDHRDRDKVFLFYTMMLSLLAFFYLPPKSADLTRLLDTMYHWAGQSLGQLLRSEDEPYPIGCRIYLWFVGQLEVEGFLPAVTALLYYLMVFSIFTNVFQGKQYSGLTLAASMLFFMAHGYFLGLISGIRCYLSFAVVAYCIYGELEKRKAFEAHLLLYGIAASLHAAAVALIGLRLLYMLIQRGIGPVRRTFYGVALVAGVVLALWGDGYLRQSMQKAVHYLAGDGYTSSWEYLLCTIHLGCMMALMAAFRREIVAVRGKIGDHPLYGFCCLLTVVEVLCCFSFTMFIRFIHFQSILMIPITARALENPGAEKVLQTTVAKCNWLILVSSLMLFLACARGDLSGYKFFELS